MTNEQTDRLIDSFESIASALVRVAIALEDYSSREPLYEIASALSHAASAHSRPANVAEDNGDA